MPQELIWPPTVNLNTPAWHTLQNLLAEAPPGPDQNRLIVFGSAALRLTVADELLNAPSAFARSAGSPVCCAQPCEICGLEVRR
jgi:hypothetical protein